MRPCRHWSTSSCDCWWSGSSPAIERHSVADVREDYTVFRVTRAEHADGKPARAEEIGALDVAPLLLGESRPLSVEARRELLPHRFSYYGDDLAILTWDSALVVEPGEHDTDLQYVLEFANAQLLELRYYDCDPRRRTAAHVRRHRGGASEVRACSPAAGSPGCCRACKRWLPTPPNWSSWWRMRSR